RVTLIAPHCRDEVARLLHLEIAQQHRGVFEQRALSRLVGDHVRSTQRPSPLAALNVLPLEPEPVTRPDLQAAIRADDVEDLAQLLTELAIVTDSFRQGGELRPAFDALRTGGQDVLDQAGAILQVTPQ